MMRFSWARFASAETDPPSACNLPSGELKTEDGMETQPTDETQIPAGYRVVAVASDTWVLIAPGGARVARYFGSLELRRVARDAREHQQGGG